MIKKAPIATNQSPLLASSAGADREFPGYCDNWSSLNLLDPIHRVPRVNQWQEELECPALQLERTWPTPDSLQLLS
jgi:hypothetical protein